MFSQNVNTSARVEVKLLAAQPCKEIVKRVAPFALAYGLKPENFTKVGNQVLFKSPNIHNDQFKRKAHPCKQISKSAKQTKQTRYTKDKEIPEVKYTQLEKFQSLFLRLGVGNEELKLSELNSIQLVDRPKSSIVQVKIEKAPQTEEQIQHALLQEQLRKEQLQLAEFEQLKLTKQSEIQHMEQKILELKQAEEAIQIRIEDLNRPPPIKPRVLKDRAATKIQAYQKMRMVKNRYVKFRQMQFNELCAACIIQKWYKSIRQQFNQRTVDNRIFHYKEQQILGYLIISWYQFKDNYTVIKLLRRGYIRYRLTKQLRIHHKIENFSICLDEFDEQSCFEYKRITSLLIESYIKHLDLSTYTLKCNHHDIVMEIPRLNKQVGIRVTQLSKYEYNADCVPIQFIPDQVIEKEQVELPEQVNKLQTEQSVVSNYDKLRHQIVQSVFEQINEIHYENPVPDTQEQQLQVQEVSLAQIMADRNHTKISSIHFQMLEQNTLNDDLQSITVQGATFKFLIDSDCRRSYDRNSMIHSDSMGDESKYKQGDTLQYSDEYDDPQLCYSMKWKLHGIIMITGKPFLFYYNYCCLQIKDEQQQYTEVHIRTDTILNENTIADFINQYYYYLIGKKILFCQQTKLLVIQRYLKQLVPIYSTQLNYDGNSVFCYLSKSCTYINNLVYICYIKILENIQVIYEISIRLSRKDRRILLRQFNRISVMCLAHNLDIQTLRGVLKQLQ